jgi:hypothetical protein
MSLGLKFPLIALTMALAGCAGTVHDVLFSRLL